MFSWLFVVSLVMEAMGLPSPFFLFYALVDICIRFLDTDLSLLICLSEIEVRTEGNRLRDWHKLFVSFGWKELNLRLAVSKDINRSVLVEKIITHRRRPFQVERMDEEQKFIIGIRIGRYKPSGLRDLSRDRATKEPYWGPLVFVHDMYIRIRSIKVWQ